MDFVRTQPYELEFEVLFGNYLPSMSDLMAAIKNIKGEVKEELKEAISEAVAPIYSKITNIEKMSKAFNIIWERPRQKCLASKAK